MITLNMKRLGVRVVVAVVLLQLSQEPTLARAETPSPTCGSETVRSVDSMNGTFLGWAVDEKTRAAADFTTKPLDADLMIPVDSNLPLEALQDVSVVGFADDEPVFDGRLTEIRDGGQQYDRWVFELTPPPEPGTYKVGLRIPEELVCDFPDADHRAVNEPFELVVLASTRAEIAERVQLHSTQVTMVQEIEADCCEALAGSCGTEGCFQCWNRYSQQYSLFWWTEPGSYYIDIDFAFEQGSLTALGRLAGMQGYHEPSSDCALATIKSLDGETHREEEVCLPGVSSRTDHPEYIQAETMPVGQETCTSEPEPTSRDPEAIYVVRASTEEEAMRLLDPESTDDPPNDTSDEPISQPNDESGSKGCAVTGTGVRSESDVWFWGVLVLGAIAVGRAQRTSFRTA